MHLTRLAAPGLALATLAALVPAAARAATTTFVSDTTWGVTDALGNLIGDAQYVAVNAAYPTVQPPDVTNYGSSTTNPSWQADLSSIPGAYWVWAPGVTGATSGASLAQYSFTHDLLLDGPVTTGTISLAADDYATVSVNGSSVGSIGSITDPSVAFQAQSALTTFDIAPYLAAGSNTILIHAENGPDSFSGSTPDAPYSLNTAGVVFGGTIVTHAAPAVPESSSFALLALGLLPVGLVARRRLTRRAA